ncbi:MAG: transcriptional regulator [Alphaproteobacteria bacterium]|nr:transcriptional regulator [Alphaproteobacteria bacterium]
MIGYGQFCAIARAHELLCGRWTLLVVREILLGSARFGEIRRGIPRISRTVLSERLRTLVEAGALARRETPSGPEYALAPAGEELIGMIKALGMWGQRWLPRRATEEDNDLDPVLLDMRRRARLDALPRQPFVVRFEIGRERRRFLLLRRMEASVCDIDQGYPERLVVKGPLAALVAWWRGDVDFDGARRMGLGVSGSERHVRAFPGWFERYLFADVASAA